MTNNKHQRIWIHFSGKFVPKILFNKINYSYEIIEEINTIAKIGKNKDKLSDHSFCLFEIGDDVEYDKKIQIAVEMALKIKQKAKKERIKIEYFNLTIVYTGIQGNIELTKNEIKWLNKLNDNISIQYFYD
jgi:hypothetical protein